MVKPVNTVPSPNPLTRFPTFSDFYFLLLNAFLLHILKQVKKKRTIIVLVALLITVSTIKAQEFRLGVSGGIDASRLTLAGASGGAVKSKSGLTGGLLGEARLCPLLGVQLEVNYSSQGTAIIAEESEQFGTYKLEYLTIPILAKFYGTPKFSVYAGPQIGFLLEGESEESGQEDRDLKEFLKSTDFYAVFGSEYRFANGIFISGRYHFGLSNIVDSDNEPTALKNRYFSVRLGYSVKL